MKFGSLVLENKESDMLKLKEMLKRPFRFWDKISRTQCQKQQVERPISESKDIPREIQGDNLKSLMNSCEQKAMH